MRDHTPRNDALDHDHVGTELLATSDVVGTFAVGQSVRGLYEVSIEAPVGSFASGLAADALVVPAANEPTLRRR